MEVKLNETTEQPNLKADESLGMDNTACKIYKLLTNVQKFYELETILNKDKRFDAITTLAKTRGGRPLSKSFKRKIKGTYHNIKCFLMSNVEIKYRTR